MIRVLIVAESAVTRAGLAGLLAADDRIEIVAQALTPTDLERLVGAGSADVVVAEVNADDERVAGSLLALAGEAGAPPVVAVANDESGSWTSEALQAGVRAVLPHDAGPAEIQAAVAAAAAGLVVMRPEDAREGARPAPAREGTALSAPLTRRELEVLGMLAEGLGNKGIATRLAISERTVKFHVAAIFDKLGVTTRTEAVTAGLRRGLILL